jgi:hypothetical protein
MQSRWGFPGKAFGAGVSLALVVSLGALAAGPGPASYGDPSAAEQYMLELINAMRSDPDGAAATYGIDLNEGLPAGTISNSPKQPLTMNNALLAAARGHTVDMLVRDFFDHINPDLEEPSDRAMAEGYSRFVGENIALASVNGRSEAGGVEYLLELLFVDKDIGGRGHRVNLMRQTFTEGGMGFARGEFDDGTGIWDVYATTQNFGWDKGPFVTGVCYSDINGNGSYDIGEGLSGVTVTVAGHQTVTGTAGGYAIPITGNFTVSAEGNGIDTFVTNITVTTENVKIDFTPLGVPNGPPEVDAGLDQIVELPDSAVLNGNVTDDGVPDPPGDVTTTWSVTSGPAAVTFLSASSVATTASFSTGGTYILRLTASDGALSSYDEVTVTVGGEANGDDSGGSGGCFIRSLSKRGRIYF